MHPLLPIHSSSFYLNSDKPVFITNKNGELVSVNNVFCEKLGCIKKEILGMPLEDTGFFVQGVQQIKHRKLTRGKDSSFYMVEVRTSKGDVLSLVINTKPYLKKV